MKKKVKQENVADIGTITVLLRFSLKGTSI